MTTTITFEQLAIVCRDSIREVGGSTNEYLSDIFERRRAEMERAVQSIRDQEEARRHEHRKAMGR